MEFNRSLLPLLVTGGAGYIGSHTIIELAKAGFTNIVIIDNYSNSSPIAIDRIHEILKQELSSKTPYKLTVYNLDLADSNTSNLSKLDSICCKHKFFACLHFAGLKAVGESVSLPLEYYMNNIVSTINVLNSLAKYDCYNFIFSSSATVYGSKVLSPIREKDNEIGHFITNPYGQTKAMIEQILQDCKKADLFKYNICNLRYFNPIGAHISGLIGEDPKGIPNNLMPYLLQVAIGRREYLSVFGNDYNTRDGTGIRDYIHVVDLARGHVAALEMDIIPNTLNIANWGINSANRTRQQEGDSGGEAGEAIASRTEKVSVYNLGTGRGTTVLELKNGVEKASGKIIKYKIVGRREGDLDEAYANCDLANKKLKWKAQLTVEDACRDSWRWQMNNPMGFNSKSKNKSKIKSKL